MKSWWTRSAISARFCTKYRTIQRPRCSPSPSILPRFTIAIATTRKQYKVLAANKCSATFYGRRCSFYCHTESRFIERILFFPFPAFPRPSPSFTVKFLPPGWDAEELPSGRKESSRSPAVEPQPSVSSHACPSCTMQFHLSPRSRNPRLESLLSVRASRDPLYNLIHHLSLRTYIVQWNVKEKKEKKKKVKVVLRGGHWVGCIQSWWGWSSNPIVPTSSKHNRKFSPITYSPRSNRFFLRRFIPSIFPFVIGVGQLHLSPWQTWSFRDGSLSK